VYMGSSSVVTMQDDDEDRIQLLSRAEEETSPQSDSNQEILNNGNFLSSNWAAILLCGEMIGGSSLSLSQAIQNTGFYTGMSIYVTITLVSAFFAYALSKSYAKLRLNIKESINGKHLRDPYPQLAYHAIGPKARYIVIASILVSDFLGTAALLVLPSNILVYSFDFILFDSLSKAANLRIWIVLNAFIVIPLTWNDRLKDNKFVGFIALFTGLVANFLILLMFLLTSGVKRIYEPENHPNSHDYDVIIAIGVLLTTVDGFDVLPNIQEDMKNIHDYKKVIIKGYSLFTMVTLPVMIGGYLYFHHHHKLSDNIIVELMHVEKFMQPGPYQTVYHLFALMSLAALIIHILSTTVIQLNPSFQYLETIVICPDGLCFKRVFLRSTIVLVIMVFVELVPLLVPLMSFNGTILFVVLGIIFPGIIYIMLFNDDISMLAKFAIGFITLIFCIYMVLNVYVNIRVIATSAEKSVAKVIS